MPLPTTNLTGHWDASAADDLWQNEGRTSAVTANNDPIGAWDPENAVNRHFFKDSANAAVWKTPGSMLNPSIEFTDDAVDGWNSAWDTLWSLSAILGAGAKTVIMAIRFTEASLNNANRWTNHEIIGDAGVGFWGVYVRSDGGTPKLYHYNWDGNADTAEVTIALNTDYVVTCRHDGSNIYIGLDGGSETSAASGNTSSLGNQAKIGGQANAEFILGEIAVYDAALTGTDLSDANSYFTAKWLSGGGGGGAAEALLLLHGNMRGNLGRLAGNFQ